MRTANIPKYVRRLLKRSSFAVDTPLLRDGDDPGYTIIVPKHSIYANVDTLKGELEKLTNWAKRAMGFDYNWRDFPLVIVRTCPDENRHCRQFARVEIYDPIMNKIEYLIPRKNEQGKTQTT